MLIIMPFRFASVGVFPTDPKANVLLQKALTKMSVGKIPTDIKAKLLTDSYLMNSWELVMAAGSRASSSLSLVM